MWLQRPLLDALEIDSPLIEEFFFELTTGETSHVLTATDMDASNLLLQTQVCGAWHLKSNTQPSPARKVA